jgi:hypothetical protein
LKSKIYVAEKDFELEEKAKEIETWERRADKLVKKYDELKFKIIELENEKEQHSREKEREHRPLIRPMLVPAGSGVLDNTHSESHEVQKKEEILDIKPVVVAHIEEGKKSEVAAEETPLKKEKAPEEVVRGIEKKMTEIKKPIGNALEAPGKGNSSPGRRSMLKTSTIAPPQPKIERSTKEKKTTFAPAAQSPTNKGKIAVSFGAVDEESSKGIFRKKVP